MARTGGRFRATMALLSRTPLKLMIVAAVFSNVVREFFPFSYFPMYSRIGGGARFLYVADLEGEAIALQTETGARTAFLKRAHRTYYREALDILGHTPEAKAAAATVASERVMHWLVEQSPRREALRASYDGLRLMSVDLTLNLENGEVERVEEVLGEISLE